MRRWRKRLLIAAGVFLGFFLLLVAAALITVQTSWFHDYVRDKMVAAIENATGGKSEIGGYSLDWKTLRAQVNGFVLHGSEASGALPLFQARSVTATLKIISVFQKKVDLQALDVIEPRIHLIVHDDGSTNVPSPKVKRKQKDTIETILDLAIKRFSVERGLLILNVEEKTPFDLRGENLRTTLAYQITGPRYAGDVRMDPLYLSIGNRHPTPIAVETSIAIEKGRIHFETRRLALAKSTFQATGDVTNLAHPEVRFRYRARVDMDEIREALELELKPRGIVQSSGNAFYAGGSRFLFEGNMHGTGVSIDLGAFHVRDTDMESGLRLDPQKLQLTRLQLSTSVNPPSAPAGKMVLVQGHIGLATLGVKTEDLDLHGVELATLGGTFEGTAQFRRFERFQTAGVVTGFDARTLLAIYIPQTVPWDGLISGPVRVEGSLRARGGITATANADISPAPGSAPVHGKVDARYDSSTETLDLGNSSLTLPATNLRFAGVLGRELKVRMETKNLDEVLPAAGLATTGPNAIPIRLQNGTATFTGIVSENLAAPRIAGHATLTNFVVDGRPFDSLAADVTASPNGVNVSNASLARGNVSARFQGSVGLVDWKTAEDSELSGSATIADASLGDVLAMLDQKDLNASGTVHFTAQVSGTVSNPVLGGDVTVTKGEVQGEPFDRLEAKVTSRGNTIELVDARITGRTRQITAAATFQHPPEDFDRGRLQFKVVSNAMPVEQFRTVANERPGVKGTVQVSADGVALLAPQAGKAALHLSDLRADVMARALTLNEQLLGDAHFTANTEGQTVVTHLDSNFAGSTIAGEGRWRLAGDYPGSAKIQFSNLDFARLRAWLSPSAPAAATQIVGSAQGNVTVEGPALRPELWKAELRIPQFQLQPAPDSLRGANTAALTLRNAEPIHVTMQNDVIRVVSAHFTGGQTDIAVSGTVSPKQRTPLDLLVKGRVNLELLQNFDPDIISSGQVDADASVRGAFQQPLLAGKLQLTRANLNYGDLPNGLSNANGTIVFNGRQANIQTLTAESGGGKIVLTGSAGYAGGELIFRIQADASGVRVRYPEGVSTVADASLALSGSSAGSLLAGTVTIQRTGFNPRTDLASVLAKSGEPERTPSAQSGFLAATQLDVQIQMAPDVTFQSSLAQNVQAEANLRLKGTALNPALLGRIVITQGQIVFFGTKFRIDQGAISFFNPVKIEPVLDIDLETRARGVEVILTVSGPLSKLNLTPRSDPPLQFSEIVALLATGNAPTSDPNVAVRHPAAPSQSFQQLGATALLGQALANPVAGRLQRFFGVTKLRIDPSLQGVENNPQARITIEQQVTPDITFTYITNITNSNPQVVRIEWALNRTWSVVALREENGIFGVDFLYKKRFK